MQKPTIKNRLKKLALTMAWGGFSPFSRMGKYAYDLGVDLQFRKEWGAYPCPEWFNHDMEFSLFPRNRLPHFFERGVYASEVVKGKRVLDICCGDGSVAALFVAPHAKSIVSVDFDPSAIAHANKRWSAYENCKFVRGDIRQLEVGKAAFDVCLWDAAIEHFTQDEMNKIFASIKSALVPGGLVHGSTVKKTEHAGHHEHEYEFDTLAELKEFLLRYFQHVVVWERPHADRTTFYFRCSDSPIQSHY